MNTQKQTARAEIPRVETISEKHITHAVVYGDWYQKRRIRLYRRATLETLRKLGAQISKN